MPDERPILLEGGRVIDPSQGMDRITNLLIEDGRIAEHWDVMQGATLRDHTILMQN